MVENSETAGREPTTGSRGKGAARKESDGGKRNWSRKTLLRELIKFARSANVKGTDNVDALVDALKDSILEDEVGTTDL